MHIEDPFHGGVNVQYIVRVVSNTPKKNFPMGHKHSSVSNESALESPNFGMSAVTGGLKTVVSEKGLVPAGEIKNQISLTLRLSVARAYLDRQQQTIKLQIFSDTNASLPVAGALAETDQNRLIFTSKPVAVSSDGAAFFGGVELSLDQLASGSGFGNLEFRVLRAGPSQLKVPRQSKVPPEVANLLAKSVISYTDLERAGEAAGRKYLFLVFLPTSGQLTFGVGALSVSGMTREYSFSDYMRAGLSLRLMVGIDMTRSNGDPRARGSLHAYRVDGVPGHSNEYVNVIESVLEILQETSGNSNPEIPAYGFGAKLPPSLTRVSHCFSLSGDFFSPTVRGIPGILTAYKEALGAVVLHGPTKFSELFKVAAGWAEPLEGSSSYLVLLLVTDGAMEDLQQTIDVLVTMDKLPVSIIIVGVGDADFSNMERLDGDKQPLVSSITGETLRRDLVQFVRYRDHPAPVDLARASLEELPKQIIKYYAGEKIFPNPTGGFVGLRKKIAEIGPPKFLQQNRDRILESIHNTGYEGSIAERIIKDVGVLCPDPLHVLDVMFSVKKRTALTWTSSSQEGPKSIAERLGVEDRLVKEEKLAIQKRRAGKLTKESRNIADAENIIQTGVCRVCYTNYIDTVFKPCGHQLVCMDCSTKVGKLCPLCRATIDSTVEVGSLTLEEKK